MEGSELVSLAAECREIEARFIGDVSRGAREHGHHPDVDDLGGLLAHDVHAEEFQVLIRLSSTATLCATRSTAQRPSSIASCAR